MELRGRAILLILHPHRHLARRTQYDGPPNGSPAMFRSRKEQPGLSTSRDGHVSHFDPAGGIPAVVIATVAYRVGLS